MRIFRQGKRGRLGAALLLSAAVWLGGAMAMAEEIPWKDQTFTKTSIEENIQDILREILQRNGMEVYFRPGVEGEVTFEFSNMPLQGVFNKVMEEYGLQYIYNAGTNVVTIYEAESQQLIQDVYTPSSATVAEVLHALERFRLRDPEVEIKADANTGSIFLSGPQSKVRNISNLMAKIDSAYKTQKERALQNMRDSLERETIDTQRAYTNLEVEIIPLRFANVDSTTTSFQGETVTVPGIMDSLSAFVGNLAVRRSNEQQQNQEAMQAVQAGYRPMVSIDKRTNSVIVQGTRQQIERIKEVVQQLDRPVDLVEIEVMIVSSTLNLNEELGFNWGYQHAFGKAPGAVPAATTSVGTAGATGISGIGAPGTRGGVAQLLANATGTSSLGFVYQGSRYVLDAQLAALANDNKVQAIASPRVVTLNNMNAKITNSQNASYTISNVSGTNASGSVDLKTISYGVTMDITPSVIREELAGGPQLVRLKINAKNSSLNTAPGNGSTITTNEQEVNTEVIIPETATYIMGGLFDTTRTERVDRVPGLSSVPLLGALFRKNTSSDNKSETTFFITPRVHSSEELVPREGRQLRDYMNTQRERFQRAVDPMQSGSPLLDVSVPLEEDE